MVGDWLTIVETKYGRFFKISTIASGADSGSPDEDESATRSYSSEAASAAARAALLLLSSGCTKIRCSCVAYKSHTPVDQ